MSLVQVGLSVARQVLEGAALPPGSLATLRVLRDPGRHPPVPREAVGDRVNRELVSSNWKLNNF